jgi:hypothetical protein
MNWIKLAKYCETTGDTSDAVHARRRKRQWIDGVHCQVGPDGNLWVNLERSIADHRKEQDSAWNDGARSVGLTRRRMTTARKRMARGQGMTAVRTHGEARASPTARGQRP